MRTRITEAGVAWLIAQQRPDGSFPGGVRVTSHAALALGLLDLDPGATSRALDHLAARAPAAESVEERALAVTTLATLRPLGWQATVEAIADQLRGDQLVGSQWLSEADRGGFRSAPGTDASDLHVSRLAIEALAAAGAGGDDPAMEEARRFVLACRARGGGFRNYLSTPDNNRGSKSDASWGMPTCDGVLALRAIGGADEDVGNGVVWLKTRFRADEGPGVGLVRWRSWGRATRFGWRAAATQVFSVEGGPTRWGDVLASALTDEQQPDGSWVNELSHAGEDDPVLATSFALYVLAVAPVQK